MFVIGNRVCVRGGWSMCEVVGVCEYPTALQHSVSGSAAGAG